MRTLKIEPLAFALVFITLAAQAGPSAGGDAATTEESSIADRISKMEVRKGLLDIYLDREKGEVWLALPEAAGSSNLLGSYLYVEGLVTGLGSNPVGLDRGQLGDSRVVELRRVGEKLFIVQPNLSFRALSDNQVEREATRQSFATSVLWAGKVEAAVAAGQQFVNLTSFIVRDAHGVSTTLAQAGQGKFQLDPERSAVALDRCQALPENVEFEAHLTYSSEEPGTHVRATAPTPSAMTLVQHHSLVRLPDDGYKTRDYDPRAGSFAIQFQDYAAPLDASIQRRWIVRHRLVKADPTAAVSLPVEAIVYYVDPGIPEPIRSAVLEGANWWAEAFEAAGFKDAYRVELLPEDVHPLDSRYNVIEWVHRSTRGWSYGGGIVDPRTGEMLKAHVILGSLRVRQDRLLFEGLAGTGKTGSGAPDDPVQLALARIRQLAAHEVGHTLGLNHNFAASTWGRASVMDYPAPWVKISDDGELDFSEAYGVGVGAWDLHTIRWAYSQFGDGEVESVMLEDIVEEGLDRGYLYLTDQDARPAGAAHPLANLWDNGSDPVAELERLMQVRRIALDRFGEDNVLPGTPLALLEEVLAPLYFHHRYQLVAASKVVGGAEYSFKLRGDEQPLVTPVAAEEQRRALKTIVSTMNPEELDLGDSLLAMLPPRPAGYYRYRELFNQRTAPVFDALGAAEAAADLSLRVLLQPERAARMVDQHRRDTNLPGFEEVLSTIVEHLFESGAESERLAELRRSVQQVALSRLIDLAGDEKTAPAVQARTEAAISTLARSFENSPGAPGVAAQHRAHLWRRARRFLERPASPSETIQKALELPPGDPIGSAGPDYGRCSWNPLF